MTLWKGVSKINVNDICVINSIILTNNIVFTVITFEFIFIFKDSWELKYVKYSSNRETNKVIQ